MAYSVCFLTQRKTTCTGMTLPTVDWALQHPSQIKRMPYRLSYEQILGGHFLIWDSNFPNDSSLGQVGKKTNQHKQYSWPLKTEHRNNIITLPSNSTFKDIPKRVESRLSTQFVHWGIIHHSERKERQEKPSGHHKMNREINMVGPYVEKNIIQHSKGKLDTWSSVNEQTWCCASNRDK